MTRDMYEKFGMDMAEATAEYIKASAKTSNHHRIFWTGWLAGILLCVDRRSGEAAILAFKENQGEDND